MFLFQVLFEVPENVTIKKTAGGKRFNLDTFS